MSRHFHTDKRHLSQHSPMEEAVSQAKKWIVDKEKKKKWHQYAIAVQGIRTNIQSTKLKSKTVQWGG